ncbi:MAG: peptidase, partial [Pirellulales bacterium]
ADRYVQHYRDNAENLPFYLVAGELDGLKSATNAPLLDHYLTRAYNATVVEYQGRGHEHFSDEILNLFDWMGRYERNFYPREFQCRSMRSWDNFFWWVELDDLPPRTIVEPESWPPGRGTRAAETRATVTATNGVNIRTGAGRVTVWLSPGVIDFQQRTSVTVNGASLRLQGGFIEPDLAVLLEDARTRADRKHPFWAKVELPTGRINVAE